MAEIEIVADGLRFPEGPVAMADGSVILVEIAAGRITRVRPDGSKETVAEPGGGPNGLAIGPDGKLYCCNNGGFNYIENNGFLAPHGQADDYSGGPDRADRHRDRRGRNPLQGRRFRLHAARPQRHRVRRCRRLLVHRPRQDHGTRDRDVTGIFYAKADGSHLEEVIFPSENPNGVGLSPDGKRLYAAETYTCRLMAFNVIAPGKVDGTAGPGGPGIPLYRPAGYKFFDSLGVEARRQHLRRDDRRMRDQRDLARRRAGRVRADRRHLHHQYLLGRGGHAGCLYLPVGQRAAGEDALGAAGVEAAVQRLRGMA